MRPDEANSEEEGLLSRRQLDHLRHCSLGDQAIRIDIIFTFQRLINRHLFGVLANLAVGQSMHDTTRVLPVTARHQAAIP